MAGYRVIRAAELIQAEIADLLLRHLRHARAYINYTGTETAQRAALEGLLHAAGLIRNQRN